MNVYFNSNFWGHLPNEVPLKRIDINYNFTWNEINGKIAAIYVGTQGMVVDMCQYVPSEKIDEFCEKWKSHESNENMTYEQQQILQYDNPIHTDYEINLSVNGHELERHNGSSGTFWYPTQVRDDITEELVKEYNCDINYAWEFRRTSYAWNDEELEPKTLTFDFIAQKVQAYAKPFTIKVGCDKYAVAITSPHTSKQYELTIHSLEPIKIENDESLPNNCHVLKYAVTPALSQSEFTLVDANQGDNGVRVTPQSDNTAAIGRILDTADGPTSIFFVGEIAAPKLDSNSTEISALNAYSSIYNDIKPQIEWYPVFHIKRRNDMKFTVKL